MNSSTNFQFEYVQGQSHPSHSGLLAEFQSASDRAAASASVRIDVPYGAHQRQRLDVFPSVPCARGLMLYLHAGYWQSRDKSLFRWLAPTFQQRGFHVVMANYPLCPDVSLPELVQGLPAVLASTRTVLAGAERLPLVVAGHSAGAHLATELALSHGALPATAPSRVSGVWAISGIYDLDPLRYTTLNERLRLDEGTAQRMSPVHRVVGDGVPAVWLAGARETPEFRRQNLSMHNAWQDAGRWSAHVEADGRDHFTVLQSWAALEGNLADVFESWWKAVEARG